MSNYIQLFMVYVTNHPYLQIQCWFSYTVFVKYALMTINNDASFMV